MALRPILVWPIMCETEPCRDPLDEDCQFCDEDTDQYPWKGAIIAFGVVFAVVIFGVIPWVWGMANIIKLFI